MMPALLPGQPSPRTNRVDPGETGPAKQMRLVFRNLLPDTPARIRRVDNGHSNVLPVYRAMGSPTDPTPEQVAKLNAAPAIGPAVIEKISGDRLDLTLEPNALVLIELGPDASAQTNQK